MRILIWLFRGFIFFALFAFALNNRHEVVVHWFFGRQWHTPLVMVVLATLTLGCALGVLATTPSWWRRRTSKPHRLPNPPAPLTQPPREGL